MKASHGLIIMHTYSGLDLNSIFALSFALRNLDVRRYLTGSTRAKLTKSAAERIKLTLPEDRDDQERIASILDQASATAEVCKKSIEELDKLQQSVFLEMFGDPVKNSKGWPVKTLLSLCDQSRGISYGVVQRGQHVEGGIPLVRIKDILNGIVDPNSLVKCEKKIVERYERTSLKGGELLISIRGTVGVTALVPESLQGANISRDRGGSPRGLKQRTFRSGRNCVRGYAVPNLQRYKRRGSKRHKFGIFEVFTDHPATN